MTLLPRVLDSNLAFVRRICPISLSIEESLIPLSSASMQIRKDDVLPVRTWVELFTPNGSAGIFRTRVPQVTHGSAVTTVQFDHAISEVGDWLIQTDMKLEASVAQAFASVFAHYRGTRWQLGTINASETVTVETDYGNVLEQLLSILKQVPKYYMTFDFSTTPWTIGLAEKSNTVSAEGRMSRNVHSAVVKRDDKDLCTRVYVKGLPKPVGRENDENAIGYMDADTISVYGIVEAETGGSDLTQEQAERVALAYLDEHKHPKLSVEIDAEDLSSITGETLDSFKCGKLFRLAVPEDNAVIEDYITKISWSDVFGSQLHANVVIGEEQDAVINFLRDQQSSNKSGRSNAKKQDKINEGLGHKIEETDQHWQSIYWDNYNGLVGRIEQTAAYWQAEYTDMYNGLRGFVEITAQHFESVYTDMYNGLSSRVEQTAAYWRSVLDDEIGSVRTIVEQTASGWRTALSGVMSNGKVTAASIATALNSQGAAGVKIDGDWVKINASTNLTLSDVMTIDTADNDSIVRFKTTKFRVGTNVGNLISFTNGVITASGYEYKDTSDNQVKPIIVKAEIVSTNTLRLTKSDGNYVDFSKAVTLSGAWSSGVFPLTINATQTNGGTTTNVGSYEIGFGTGHDVGLYLGTNGTPTLHSGSNTLIDAPLAVYTVSYVSSQDPNHKTNRYTETVPIDASVAYNKGKSDATVTAGTSVITWDSTNKYFYNYGYAYLNGSSQANATSTKRTSSTLSLNTGSWSNGSRSINVYYGLTSILSASVSVPDVSETTWENTTGNYWRARLSIGGVYRYSTTKEFVASKTIKKISLDSGMNHVGNWWNYVITYTDNTTQLVNTDQSTTGLYMSVPNVVFTSNGTYDSRSEGHAGYQIVTVNVAGGSSGPTKHDAFAVSVTQDASGNHVTISKTYPLGSSCPFTTTSSKNFYWY